MNTLPSVLTGARDSPYIVDAVYYVVRVLRNARRGFKKVEVSTEPSRQARALAEKAIREIEAVEQSKIVRMRDERIDEYISSLQSFLTSRSPSSDRSAKDAEELLAKLRLQQGNISQKLTRSRPT
jgi:hypothetical protein